MLTLSSVGNTTVGNKWVIQRVYAVKYYRVYADISTTEFMLSKYYRVYAGISTRAYADISTTERMLSSTTEFMLSSSTEFMLVISNACKVLIAGEINCWPSDPHLLHQIINTFKSYLNPWSWGLKKTNLLDANQNVIFILKLSMWARNINICPPPCVLWVQTL